MNKKMIMNTINDIKKKIAELEQLLIKKIEIIENKTIYSNVFEYNGEYILLSKLENFSFDKQQIELSIYLNKEIIQITYNENTQRILPYLQENLPENIYDKIIAAIHFTKSLTANAPSKNTELQKEKVIKINIQPTEKDLEEPEYKDGIVYNVLRKLNKIKIVRSLEEAKQLEKNTKELQPNYKLFSTYAYVVAEKGEGVFQYLASLNELEQIVFVDEELKDELWVMIMKYELEKFVFVNKKKIKISEFD